MPEQRKRRNSPKTAAKHYLQVTEDHYREAAQGNVKCNATDDTTDAEATQIATSQVAARAGAEPKQALEVLGVMRSGSNSCDAMHSEQVPRAGLEPALAAF